MNEEPKFLETQLKRRDFLTKSALLGGSVVVGTQTPWLIDSLGGNGRREIKPNAEYTLARPENIIYSVCQQCNTQSGIQTGADPYRIVRVLKRDGPRGSMRWKSIPFDEALEEIINGGDLFGEGPVTGLSDIWALRDHDVAKAMAKDVQTILDEKETEKKKELVEKFKADHADHLDALIDPDHPDLGPKNNQFAFVL